MSTASTAMSGVPFEVLVSVDEWRDDGIVTARGLLSHLADVGATAVKIIACHPDHYSTRPVRVTHALSKIDPRLAAVTNGAPGASADLLAEIRSHLGRVPLVVAPYDIASCLEAATAGIDTWQVDEAMNGNVPLLEVLAGAARRVYFCTWGCTQREIDAARTILHATELVFLHRVRGSPASALMRDCATIAHLSGLGHRVGWKEPRPTRSHAIIALAVGGSVVEIPAITGDLDASEAAARVAIRIARLRGLAASSRRVLLGYSPDELDQVDDLRPGLVAACAIPAGTVLTRDMIAFKAPAVGLSVEHLGLAIGRRALYDLRPNEPLTFGVVL
ncbi:MAG: SAF domain-containing protein [Acidobacteria bacterium]|nr:SAF domain-containing protein [Acidobacteriota bacterium]